MCDTFVSLASGSKDKTVIFGKNSDRPNSEIQLITYAPKTKYSKGDTLKCTYISIPQVSETAAVILSQPWWMWGAEMGANEYDVVIGNEAVYTHEPLRRIGLLGMDLLRLGLERGKTAKEALNVIIDLLEEYGQGGGCAYGDSTWTYHNSFLIADTENAYVLETADKWWIVEKVKNVRSISNGISIRGKGDYRKKGIIQHAIEQGYCKDDDDFDFAITFSGSFISDKPSPYSRGGKSTILLNQNKGNITPKLMMEFLREHQAGICMHGGFESTGSQVSQLRKDKKSVHWFTGSTLPCLSIYKPYIFPIDNQKYFNPGPYLKINQDWFWIRHRKFISKYNQKTKKEYLKKLKNAETELIHMVNDIITQEINQSEINFLNNLRIANLEAWKKSEELLY
ncbi:MAG: C69 family dipeptidase [Promethearchaeota archaeon]